MDKSQPRRPRRLLLAVVVFGLFIGVFALSLFNSSSEPLEAREVQRPNFVFILADDMRKSDLRSTPAYRGIRTNEGRKYLEYQGGRRELYNLGPDPYELRNRYKAAAPPSGLATRLKALKAFAGTSCRSAENAR